MKKSLRFILLSLFAAHFINAQEYFNTEAEKYIRGAEHIRYTEFTDIPDFIRMKPGNEIPFSGFVLWAKTNLFAGNPAYDLILFQTNQDDIGFTHYRYKQIYKGTVVEGAVLNVHSRNGRIVSLNGRLANIAETQGETRTMNEQTALDFALAHINASLYKWQLAEEEKLLKEDEENPGATYFPKGETVWFSYDGNYKNNPPRKTWKFNIYAHEPLYRAEIFVDAATGKILFENNLLHDANTNATAVTGYSGNQTIVSDSFGGSYRLRETTRGQGVQTYNLQRGTNYGNAVDFTDADNYWNNVNANLDQYATDAHWGAEMTYDYYFTAHNRNSINGSGMIMRSYVHYSTNYFNAFWDGQRVTYGDGDNNNPLVALDICGHEFTHGVTGFTAGLVYQNQSGALNESFSDIFGTAVEFYAKPGSANWLVGENIGVTLRSMSNPNAYGDPDTYNGTYWYTGTGDNGGVHTNSGVQNHWFYRLVQGGSGTNDIGNVFNVTGIGMTDAARIAYRNLTVYLGANSVYTDARFYSIQAAIDLFGPCTQQVISTTNAWYAVGVGAAFSATVTADFTAALTTSCSTPFTVSFTNLSTNAGTFSWNFGDGNTSTATNPTHTYTTYGDFTVTLVASGGACGSDTKVRTNYISINASNPCVAVLPPSGTGTTQTSCQGILFDNGGPGSNYTDQSDVSITIAPPGASSVIVNFTSFNYETNYDYVYLYDGPTTASPLIGQYTGNTLPNNGNAITTTTGYLTVRQTSDQNLNYSGFEMNWVCLVPNSPPVVNFSASPTSSCTGAITFTDNSVPTPTSWLWDFGDGATSTQQNPTHTYGADGIYTVTLTATNNFGSNTLVRNNLVTIDKPDAPAVTHAMRCDPGSVLLRASALSGGTLNWFTSPSGGSSIATGGTYNTPVLNTTTSYYVEENVVQPPQNVGPTSNAGGGGYFNGTQSLLFDAYTPFTLVSVLVYANGSGNRTIQLRNSNGTVIQSATINIPNGSSRITLNFSVPVGNNLQLGVTANANLYRNNAGVSYPYSIPGTVSITNSTAGTQYYYSFYDWEIQRPNCISERAQVTATIYNAPSVTDASRCGTGSVTLAANGADNLNWYDAPSAGNLVNTGATFNTPSLSATTTYYVASDVVPPSMYVGPVDNTFGDGGNFTGNQHLKFDCSSAFTLVSVKVYANGAGNRTVELRNSSGTLLQSAVINMPNGESRITLNFNISPGSQYQLGIGGTPNLYRNSTNAAYPYTLPGIVSITGSSAGQPGYYYYFYDWEVRQSGCSTSRTPVTATINPLPSVTTSADADICPGDDVTLTATDIVGNLVWSPGGATTTSITVSPASTTTYTASATNSCGTASDNVVVTVNPLPAVNVSEDENICAGDDITLTASGIVGNLIWSPGGATTASITVSPTSTTTYTASASTFCGTASEDAIVTVLPAPSVIVPGTQVICAGDAVTLTASDISGNLVWSPGGATTAAITVSPTSNTTYTASATTACGTASGNVLVVVNPLPAITLSGDQSICAGDNVTLSATGLTGSIVWEPGGATSAFVVVAPTVTTVYTATVTNTCGSITDDVTISVTPLPAVSVSDDVSSCAGDIVTLAATGVTGNLVWSPDGETTDIISVNPFVTTTYTASATNTCGTASDTVTVTVNTANTPTISDLGGLLLSSPGETYQWYLNGTLIPGANQQEYLPSEEGIYTVEITDANGCSALSDEFPYITIGIGNNGIESIFFSAFPNPNNGFFTILCSENIQRVMIYNSLGELVNMETTNNTGTRLDINLSDAAAGVYFMKARTEGNSFALRIVVER